MFLPNDDFEILKHVVALDVLILHTRLIEHNSMSSVKYLYLHLISELHFRNRSAKLH